MKMNVWSLIKLVCIMIFSVGFFVITFLTIKKIKKNMKKNKRHKAYKRWLKRVRRQGKNW